MCCNSSWLSPFRSFSFVSFLCYQCSLLIRLFSYQFLILFVFCGPSLFNVSGIFQIGELGLTLLSSWVPMIVFDSCTEMCSRKKETPLGALSSRSAHHQSKIKGSFECMSGWYPKWLLSFQCWRLKTTGLLLNSKNCSSFQGYLAWWM